MNSPLGQGTAQFAHCQLPECVEPGPMQVISGASSKSMCFKCNLGHCGWEL